jgi:hypothetical protein
MDREMELAHLANAEKAVANGERHIFLQKNASLSWTETVTTPSRR